MAQPNPPLDAVPDPQAGVFTHLNRKCRPVMWLNHHDLSFRNPAEVGSWRKHLPFGSLDVNLDYVKCWDVEHVCNVVDAQSCCPRLPWLGLAKNLRTKSKVEA